MGRLTKQDWKQLDNISNQIETNETRKQQYLINADEPIKSITRKLEKYINKHTKLTKEYNNIILNRYPNGEQHWLCKCGRLEPINVDDEDYYKGAEE